MAVRLIPSVGAKDIDSLLKGLVNLVGNKGILSSLRVPLKEKGKRGRAAEW